MTLCFDVTRGTKIKWYMYKVKRFSQVRQKNYGLLGDLRHSGL